MDIKVIVFDLDDTLLDTTKLLIPIAKSNKFLEVINKPLPLIEGALENLQYLSKKYQLCLLTMGNPEIQKKKIKSLEIEQYFQQVLFADSEKKETKNKYFHKLVKDYSINDRQFLSVGNRRSVDIRQAKLAGGMTCLYKYGEHEGEEPMQDEDIADFEIQHHNQLIATCKL